MNAGRLGVTNLAWPSGDDAAGMALLASLGVTGIEIAPAHSLGAWDSSLMDRAARLRDQAAAHGLAIIALQGWLYGVDGVSLFGPRTEQAALLRHLERVATLAEFLGATACVWGAPRSRDPFGLGPDAAFEHARQFLLDAGPIFAERNAVLTFEANAALYGCRFVTHTAEAIALVSSVGARGIMLQVDIGTIILNGEPPSVIVDAAPWIGHVHISEPGLAPVGSTGFDHGPTSAALREIGWRGSVSVEMKATTHWRRDLTSAIAAAAIYDPVLLS